MINHITIIHKDKDIMLISKLKAFIHMVGIPCTIFNIDNTWDMKHFVKMTCNDIVIEPETTCYRLLEYASHPVVKFKDIEDLLYRLLNDNYYIDINAYHDLSTCYRGFSECNYDFLYHLGYNCQTHQDQSIKSDLYNRYVKLIDYFTKTPHKTHYCMYAGMNMLFETNLFCKRHDMNYYVTNESLIEACKYNKFYKLAADTCLYITGDIYDAFHMYPRYDDEFHNETWFSLGQIFMKKFEFDHASEYFTKAIQANPNDYQSQFNMGVCSTDEKLSHQYHMNIISILKSKYQINTMDSIEYEYFFNACLGTAIELYDNDLMTAFNHCVLALNAFRSMKDLNFYRRFDDFDDRYRKDMMRYIQHHINTLQLQKVGIELSCKLSNFHYIDEFKEL